LAVQSLDTVLREFDWHEVHTVELPCAPERALATVLALPVASDPLVRVLLRLRGLGRGTAIGEALERMGFETLVRSETEIVAGMAGMPWRRRSGLRRFGDAGPGTVRIAIDFRAEPLPGGCRLSTETRIAAVDESARRVFGRYWLVVGPFSALIRRRWLAAAATASANRSALPSPKEK
jgi:hypothetical protein